uniref:Putative tetraspanin 42eq n=1 Tax=Haematobia irritans TaxID=7368 RepID=A0A1L8EGA1_HAEIR
MGCGESSLKFSLFILNILSFIFGALTLSACIYALIEFEFCEAVRIPCILGCVLSSVLFLNSILGCCGAYHKAVHLTWIYSVIMLLLMGAQIAVIFLQPIDFNKVATELIDKVWNSTDIGNDYMMTSYEIKYECCGRYGPNDYKIANETIPTSCYSHHNNTIAENLFVDGCIPKMTEMYSTNQRVEEISDWILVGIEGLCALIGGLMAITIKNVQRRKYYH